MRWILALAVMAGPAWALDDAGVMAALTGKVLAYADGTSQSFRTDGETVFFATDGKQSIGHWRVQGGQYCSVWPPSDHWACYEVKVAACKVDFVSADGSVSEGIVGKQKGRGSSDALDACNFY